METIYLICAVVGATLIVCQFVLTLIGLGGDHGGDAGGDMHGDVGGHDFGHHDVGGHDAPGHHDGAGHHHGAHGHAATNWLFGLLSFRTVVAGLAFFGLTGLAMLNNTSAEPAVAFVAAVAAACLAVVVVGTVMRSLHKLNLDGTVRIQKAVGSRGTVYLSIPGGNGGEGKVHVSVQGQLKEYKAVTSHGGLPTGTKIVVVRVVGSDTVEVGPVESLEASGKS
jgi:membrane protein implicated in regulation of membrane protease activity